MSKSRDEQLHRLHDGDLSADERAVAEKELGPEDRERLAALNELGALVRHTYAAEAEGFDVAAAVMKALPAAKATPIEAARRKRSRLRIGAAGISAVVAIAAAAALFLLPRGIAIPTDGCQIESLEVSGAQATVMDTEDGRGGAGTVVWIDEEES